MKHLAVKVHKRKCVGNPITSTESRFDLNGDEEFNILDLVLITQMIAETGSVADVNGKYP